MARRRLTIKTGVEKLEKDLQSLYGDATGVIAQAVYVGAGKVADAYKAEIAKIPVDNRPYVREGMKTGLQSRQIAGLMEGAGIAHFQHSNGMVETKVGMDGYNDIRTERWPQGQPNAMVARSITAGTSWLRPYDFVGRTRRAVADQAKTAMAAKVEEEIAKKMTGG